MTTSEIQLLNKDMMDAQRDSAFYHHVNQENSQEAECFLAQPTHDWLFPFPWAYDETSNDDNMSVGEPALGVPDPENLTIASIIDQGILCRVFTCRFAPCLSETHGFLTENGWISKTLEDEAAQKVWRLADNPPHQWPSATCRGNMICFGVYFTLGWIRARPEWSQPIYSLQSGTTRPLKLWVANVVQMQQDFLKMYGLNGSISDDQVEKLMNDLQRLIFLTVVKELATQSRQELETQREAAKILSQLAVFSGRTQDFESEEEEFTLVMMLQWYFALQNGKAETRFWA